jgi:ABC-2 type transport system ATP-binding protein
LDAVITADRVSKRFLVAQRRPTAHGGRSLHPKRAAAEFWVLRDISLEIRKGETVALLGRNGSGKSTLLSLLGGILAPTSGLLQVRGRVASLIELGAGFNGELTGRENIYLNASILGLTRREVHRCFDDIVEFSGLAQFIDNQVKHYSTGMYVRLGFAVAAHVDPDVLLVDEVLAVGDDAFQQKCLAKVAEFQAQGRTILFVTHALDLAPMVCHRGILLDQGSLVHDGPVTETVRRLRSLLSGSDADGGATTPPNGPRISGLRVVGSPAASTTVLPPGAELVVDVTVDCAPDRPAPMPVVSVTGPLGMLLFRLDPASKRRGWLTRPVTVRFRASGLPLFQGVFGLMATLADPATGTTFDTAEVADALQLTTRNGHGLLQVPYECQLVAGAPSSPFPDAGSLVADEP